MTKAWKRKGPEDQGLGFLAERVTAFDKSKEIQRRAEKFSETP